MLSLLRSEWYQIRKALSVKIAFGMILVVSVVFGIQYHAEALSDISTGSGYYEESVLFGGGCLIDTMSDAAACMLLASLFSGLFISAAFENRTFQAAVSCGKSRTKIYMAKMIMFLFIVTGLCLVYWFASSMPAFLNGLGTQEETGNLCHIEYIAGVVFTAILAYSSLFMVCGVIGFWNQKASQAMGISLVSVLFGGSLLARLLPEKYISVINHTPLGLYERVLKLDVSWEDMGKTCFWSLVWIVMIGGIGLWKFKKMELK